MLLGSRAASIDRVDTLQMIFPRVSEGLLLLLLTFVFLAHRRRQALISFKADFW